MNMDLSKTENFTLKVHGEPNEAFIADQVLLFAYGPLKRTMLHKICSLPHRAADL